MVKNWISQSQLTKLKLNILLKKIPHLKKMIMTNTRENLMLRNLHSNTIADFVVTSIWPQDKIVLHKANSVRSVLP